MNAELVAETLSPAVTLHLVWLGGVLVVSVLSRMAYRLGLRRG